MKVRKRISKAVDSRIRERFRYSCAYCLAQQRYVLDKLEVEHIIPVAAGGTDEEENLCLSCGICNGHKGIRVTGIDPISGNEVALYNPRTQLWSEHFKWGQGDDQIKVIGLTPVGRATVLILQLDSDPTALDVRANWVAVGWHPPKD
jgi:hypothetical protein